MCVLVPTFHLKVFDKQCKLMACSHAPSPVMHTARALNAECDDYSVGTKETLSDFCLLHQARSSHLFSSASSEIYLYFVWVTVNVKSAELLNSFRRKGPHGFLRQFYWARSNINELKRLITGSTWFPLRGPLIILFPMV